MDLMRKQNTADRSMFPRLVETKQLAEKYGCVVGGRPPCGKLFACCSSSQTSNPSRGQNIVSRLFENVSNLLERKPRQLKPTLDWRTDQDCCCSLLVVGDTTSI